MVWSISLAFEGKRGQIYRPVSGIKVITVLIRFCVDELSSTIKAFEALDNWP
jgi:hypothetical protein